MDYSKITSPSDIKGYTLDELEGLADFCRGLVLKRTSEFGGHVGPNLGVVEATIAMLNVFDLPKDKVVWDVSHQVDTFKMLTGRMDAFVNPVPYSVIGEYTIPSEAPEYDLFYAGHTSPSITLCLGLAKARDQKGEKHNIIAFIGDGSLSGGVAFEGLNEAAELKSNFIVVVNDNQMAIPPDQGGLYANLQELRETNGTTANNYFKTLGFDYRYVAQGNDIRSLKKVFEEVKDSDHPVVVHINTQKGEGYAAAEEDREGWHSHTPYYIDSSQVKAAPKEPNISTVTRDYLLRKVKEDPRVLIVATSTPDYYGFGPKQREEVGKQYVDLCIAEQCGTSVTAGAAKGGIRPIYPVAGTFLQRAYDQVIEDICLDNVPAVLVTLYTGVYGYSDATHVGFWDISMLSNIPRLVYLAPTGYKEYQAMMDWALAQEEYPVAIRAPWGPAFDAEENPDTDYSDINRFKKIKEGKDVAVIAAGDFYKLGLDTVDKLAKKDVHATLINPRFVSGVDEEMLRSLEADHSLVVTLEDGTVEGGFGQKVASFYSLSPMKVLVRGLRKEFRDRYDTQKLLEEYRLTPDLLSEDILEIISGR